MPFPPDVEPTVQRRLELHGEDAAEWLGERGLVPHDHRRLRLYGDEFRAPGFRLARVWHTDATLTVTPPSSSTLIMAQMDGEFDVRGSSSIPPARGDAVAISKGAPVTIAHAKGGRYEADVRLDHLPAGVERAVAAGAVLRSADSAFRSIFVSSVNVALNSSMSPTDRSFPAFQSTIRTILTGLLLERLDGEIYMPRSLGALYERAYQVVLMNAMRPSFSAADLPGLLSVSPSYLRRAFAAHGATAARTIRHVRAATARDYLLRGEQSLTREDIARLSGFRSVRAMSKALNSSDIGRAGPAELLMRREPPS